MLDIVARYHCMQFQGKSMIQTQENYKKSHFRPDLDPLGLNLGRQFFFSKICQLPSCTISENANDPILRKFSDRRTVRQRDRYTDETDFIGHCPTNLKRPK